MTLRRRIRAELGRRRTERLDPRLYPAPPATPVEVDGPIPPPAALVELGRRLHGGRPVDTPTPMPVELAPDYPPRPLPPEPGLRYLVAAILERTGGLAWDDAERLAGEVLDRHGRDFVSPESARRIADELLEVMDP